MIAIATKMSSLRLKHFTEKRNIYCSLTEKVENQFREVVNYNRELRSLF